jgi:hypothetical protein
VNQPRSGCARGALLGILLATPAAQAAAETCPPPPEAGESTTLRGLLAPPQRRELTRVRGTARPFLNAIGPGGGAVVNLAVEHYFATPLKLSLELAPAALAVTSGAVGSINHLRVGAAYAGDFVELGLAAGSRVQNFGPGGLSLAAHVRLGALDGFHLALAYGYVLFRNHYTGQATTGFSNVLAAIRIPVLSQLAVVVDGGLSLDVWMFSTLGLEHRLTGQGGAGTWLLRGGFGLAWVLDRFPCQYRDPAPCAAAAWALGPTISLGLERRF